MPHFHVALAVCLLGANALAQGVPTAPTYGSQHEREFDFWVGEWDVHNRALGASGWQDAGAAVARIRPILGGKAILEEWEGKSGRHANTFGVSVRHYDPERQRWILALNWPSATSAAFSNMQGTFRHGRAEFFAPTTSPGLPSGSRFTFSDAAPDTCRWDMASSPDGSNWRTTWIMEFSRTKSAAAVVGDGEPIRAVPERCVCAASEARDFDPLVGTWSGTGSRLDAGRGRRQVTASFRASSTNRGCATLCFLDVMDGADVSRSFEVWAWSQARGCWIARAIDDRTPKLDVLIGGFVDATGGSFVRTNPSGERLECTRRVCYEAIGSDRFRLRHELTSDHGETWSTALTLEFERN